MATFKFRLPNGEPITIEADDFTKALMKVCDAAGIVPLSAALKPENEAHTAKVLQFPSDKREAHTD